MHRHDKTSTCGNSIFPTPDHASTTATAGPDDTLLQTLCEELKDVTDWFTLGVQLKVPVTELKAIEAKYHSDIKRCKLETLTVMLNMERNPTTVWKRVVEALRRMDMTVVANHLANVFSVADD